VYKQLQAVFFRFRNTIKLLTGKNLVAGKIGKIVIYFGLNTRMHNLQIILRYRQFSHILFIRL